MHLHGIKIIHMSLLKKSKKYTSSFQYAYAQISHTRIQDDMNTMVHCLNSDFLLLYSL